MIEIELDKTYFDYNRQNKGDQFEGDQEIYLESLECQILSDCGEYDELVINNSCGKPVKYKDLNNSDKIRIEHVIAEKATWIKFIREN